MGWKRENSDGEIPWHPPTNTTMIVENCVGLREELVFDALSDSEPFGGVGE